jgi:hypothetical protein
VLTYTVSSQLYSWIQNALLFVDYTLLNDAASTVAVIYVKLSRERTSCFRGEALDLYSQDPRFE